MILDVYLYGQLVGNISTDSDSGFEFTYSPSAPYQLSISLPLEKQVFPAKEAEPFFSGLLPDGIIRERLATNAHCSSGSIASLLSAYGADIAGAVVILDHEEPYKDESAGYREISEAELAERIRDIGSSSLLLWGDEARLSLAGAQEKVPLFHKDGKWFLPTGNAPSNCIIKPGKELAVNEYVVTTLASSFGLNVPSLSLFSFKEQMTVVSERYDRTVLEGNTMRLQQEDMCQAMGISPELKYQSDGGPGIEDILQLIRSYSSLPILDTEAFLQCIIFDFLIGNCDAHAKNFSFLYGYRSKESVRLAPFYDLVSTTVYPALSRNLAMKIGNAKKIDRVVREDFLNIKGISRRMMETLIDRAIAGFETSLESMRQAPEYSAFKEFLDTLYQDSRPRISRLRAASPS